MANIDNLIQSDQSNPKLQNSNNNLNLSNDIDDDIKQNPNTIQSPMNTMIQSQSIPNSVSYPYTNPFKSSSSSPLNIDQNHSFSPSIMPFNQYKSYSFSSSSIANNNNNNNNDDNNTFEDNEGEIDVNDNEFEGNNYRIAIKSSVFYHPSVSVCDYCCYHHQYIFHNNSPYYTLKTIQNSIIDTQTQINIKRKEMRSQIELLKLTKSDLSYYKRLTNYINDLDNLQYKLSKYNYLLKTYHLNKNNNNNIKLDSELLKWIKNYNLDFDSIINKLKKYKNVTMKELSSALLLKKDLNEYMNKTLKLDAIHRNRFVKMLNKYRQTQNTDEGTT